MLAQLSMQYPQAREALLAQAQAGNIPDSAWQKIATGLTGDQYQFGDPRLRDSEVPAQMPGLKTYHIQSGNQNFYSLPLAMNGAPDFVERQELLDSLLGQSLPAKVKETLETARTALLALKPSK